MNDKKYLIAGLLLIIIALIIYIFFSDRTVPYQANNVNEGTPQGLNQNVTEPPSPTPAQEDSSYVSLNAAGNKNWLLDEIILNGADVSLDVTVPAALTLNFDQTGKNYSGFSGCNNYSGAYTGGTGDEFKFGATISTKMFCTESSDLENEVFQAMEKIETYQFDYRDNLILESSDKKTKLEYVQAE